jgi:hypothetical protein
MARFRHSPRLAKIPKKFKPRRKTRRVQSQAITPVPSITYLWVRQPRWYSKPVTDSPRHSEIGFARPFFYVGQTPRSARDAKAGAHSLLEVSFPTFIPATPKMALFVHFFLEGGYLVIPFVACLVLSAFICVYLRLIPSLLVLTSGRFPSARDALYRQGQQRCQLGVVSSLSSQPTPNWLCSSIFSFIPARYPRMKVCAPKS